MFVILPMLVMLTLGQASPAAVPEKRVDTNTLVNGVDQTFAKMRDFSADFVHVYTDSLNQKRQESGQLYLARDKRMKWEYRRPEEKVFYSNGKTIFWFEPSSRQVRKDEIKNIPDDQFPMLFLVGRSGLRDQFKQIELFDKGMPVLRLTPKKKGYVEQIEVEVDPANYLIRKMAMTYEDSSRAEFTFTNIRTNTGLHPSFFEFKVPPGVELIQGFGQ